MTIAAQTWLPKKLPCRMTRNEIEHERVCDREREREREQSERPEDRRIWAIVIAGDRGVPLGNAGASKKWPFPARREPPCSHSRPPVLILQQQQQQQHHQLLRQRQQQQQQQRQGKRGTSWRGSTRPMWTERSSERRSPFTNASEVPGGHAISPLFRNLHVCKRERSAVG